MKTIDAAQLTAWQARLLGAAEDARECAYNPYSKFFVGAALLSASNHVIAAANVENAAYSMVICAERAALVKANAEGHRHFRAVAVSTRHEAFDTTQLSAPCGACRQMLFEASQLYGQEMEVILATTNREKVAISTISELLPYAFGPRDLGVKVD